MRAGRPSVWSQLWLEWSRLDSVHRIAIVLLCLLALIGCHSNQDRVVGTWKGHLEAGQPQNSLESGMSALAGALVGEITLEFTGHGKVKTTIQMGSGVSDYTISGNEVTILKMGKDSKPSKLILNGDTLRSKKDFESDPVFVFTRVSKVDPGAKE